MKKTVIIGAGQAGCSCAIKLRNSGYEGKIVLIGEEAHPPYQRPPLSKAYLLGDMALERMFLRPLEFYEENGIDLHLNVTVTNIDRTNKCVTAGGQAFPYDDLVLTTGSFPHRLPSAIGGSLLGVYSVRDLNDADAMAPEFREGASVLIIGGGYIGLEAAAVAARKGLNVTLVEMSDRILQRVAAPQTSTYFRNLHRAHGVDLREGVGLDRLTGEGRVSGAELSDGSELSIDFAIVGVGIAPAIGLAEAAGLTLENGIRVDEQGRSSDPSIWAAGDCASFPYKGERIRLESVPNAIDQAECVAGNIMGAGKVYEAKPWFWSDQYDVKLQIAGLNSGYDQVVERKTDHSTSFWYFRQDVLIAVDAMNDPRGYMIGKRLIEAAKSPEPAIISDPQSDLKALLNA